MGGFAPFMRLKPKGLNNIYTATVLAFVVGAQEAAKRMQKIGGGAIVSLSSTGNLVYMPNYAGHGNSKNAVETMVKYAAVDLGEFNIRVNAVSGGPIDTDALKAFPDYVEIKEKVEEQSPLKRMGNPNDLAGAAYFYAMKPKAVGLQGKRSLWMVGLLLNKDFFEKRYPYPPNKELRFVKKCLLCYFFAPLCGAILLVLFLVSSGAKSFQISNLFNNQLAYIVLLSLFCAHLGLLPERLVFTGFLKSRAI